MAEKSFSEIPKILRDQYEKGKIALQRQNYDYAITFFNQVLEKEPGFFDCREALRATQFKKAGEKTSFFKKMIGSASNSPMIAKGNLVLRSNPLEAINIAEQILNGDPNSSSAHKLLADAALAAGLPKTALLSLEILVKASPKDKELNMELAEAYGDAGQTEKAENVYQELMRYYPNDPELSKAMKNLSAHTTLEQGGYNALADGTGSYRDILKNKDEAIALEQEKREVKSEDVAAKLISEQESKLALEPDNIRVLRSVAELYVQKKDFDHALHYYQRIMALTPDSTIEKAISDTTLKKIDFAASQLDPNAPDFAEQSAKIKSDRELFLIEESKRRVDKYPNDLLLRFDLGQAYFRVGKISEAIQELQKAQANPQRRVQSMSLLGQCFARRGMNDMAAKTLQNAIKEKPAFDDEKKELVYTLGCVFEKMGKKDEAIEEFKQIYEVDIGYKDTAAKVDAYYAGS